MDASERAVAIDLFVILAVAGFVAIIMQRMRLAVIPAYLIAGAVIGPHAMGFVPSEESLEEVSHLAIILLLFGIGLELDITVLRRGLSRMILAGLGSIVVCILAGFPIAMAFGLSRPEAVTICMALSLSSTAVVLRIITARRELRRRSGRLSFAILVVQDIVVLAMLAVLPVLARWAGGTPPTSDPLEAHGWLGFLADTCLMIGGVASLVVAAKALLPRLLRESLRGRRLEVMMLVGIAAALAAALVAQGIGFSLEMGAFLAGFVLSGTPFRHQLSGQIGPLRDIFSALFFTTVGMKLDPVILAEGWWAILLAVALLITLKTAIISGVCWAAGALASNALIVGFSLAQAGEFSLILIGAGGQMGIFGPGLAPAAIAVVVISLIATPAVNDLGRRVARMAGRLGHAPWVRTSLFGPVPDAEAQPHGIRHLIIGGFGPIGQRIAEVLDRAGVSYTIIELNPDTVVEQLRRRRSIVFGDVSNLQVLESAGIAHADALVLTVPDEEAVLRSCAVARRRSPSIFIAVRTGLAAKSGAASDIGADHVTVDELATAEAMMRVVMERLELEEPDVELDDGKPDAAAEPKGADAPGADAATPPDDDVKAAANPAPSAPRP